MQLSRSALIRLGFVAGTLIAVVAGLWFGRGPAAGFVGERVLALQGVDADLDIRDISLSGVRTGAVRLGPDDAPGVAAEAVEIKLSWPKPFGLKLERVSATGLTVRAEAADQGLTINGLPSGSGAKGGRGASGVIALPELDIKDARILIETAAGALDGRLTAEGDAARGWSAEVAFAPVTLRQGEASLALDEGSATARLIDGRIEAAAALNLRDAVGGEGRLGAASVVAAFNGAAPDVNDLTTASGQGFVRASVEDATLPASRMAAWLAPLKPASSSDGAPDAAPGVFDAHQYALIEALVAAGAGFDAEGQLAVRVADGAALVEVETPLTLRAASGLELVVETGGAARRTLVPAVRDVWAIEGLGLIVRGGASAPSGAAAIASAVGETHPEGASVAVEGVVRLEPWAVDGLSLGLDDVRFEASQSADRADLSLTGGAAFAGKRSGLDVNLGRLDVDVNLTQNADGVSIAARGADPAARFEASRFTAGETVLRDVRLSMSASASGEPILSVRDGRVTSRGRLADAQASLSQGKASHRLIAPAAEFAFDAGGGEPGTAELRAQGARAELDFGDGVSADARIVEILATFGATPGGAAPKIKATIDALEIGGPGAPVRVSDAAAQADLTLDAEGRPTGKITLARGEIVDAANPARVVAIAVSGVAELAEGRATGEASAKTRKLGDLASVRFSHDLASGEGSARFETVRLAFAPGGLQPTDIAPVTLGAMAQVRGGLRVEGEASWDDDAALAPVTITVEDLDFESPAGQLQGLSTTFKLADALTLRSDGPQLITLGLFDPGLPLPDGRFQLELTGGGAGRLFEARFPYAGGELTLEPLEFIPGDADQRGALTASDLDLVKLVGQFEVPDLVATGRVGGRVQFVYSERSVVVDGVLRSREPGEIRYISAKADQLGQAAEGAKIAFQALQELDYDTLELTIGGDLNGDMTMRMFAAGRSPNVYGGAPVEFTANFGGELARLVRRATRALDPAAILKERREQEKDAEAASKAETEAQP